MHELASKESSPERVALETDLSRKIHHLIEALPERLRRPLALSSVEGITTAQIAIAMDLPEGTVRRLLSEARALLKEKMERMEGNKYG